MRQEATYSSLGANLRKLIISVALVSFLSFSAFGASSLQLETLKTHSRLAISLDPSVETEWKDVDGGFTLLLRGVAIQDLYLGGADLERMKDPRIESVKVTEGDTGVTITGRWKFGTGANAIANPNMEKFTYREKDPARLVVDFWPKGGASVAEVKAKKAVDEKKATIARADAEAKKRRDRRIAAEAAMAIESDVARFCKEPLQEGIDLFLEFIPYHEVPNLTEYLPSGPPDENYPFLEPKKGAADESYVRLARELYDKRDYALAIRTLDFFEKEAPSSIHRVDMAFLRANAVLRLGLKEKADALFESIREKNPGSPAALASALYLAEEKRKAGNELQTIERFLWLATQYPKHRNVWAWRLIAAEALYKIKQTDRAVIEYGWVEANAPTVEAKSAASLRIGDAYLYRSQYDRALAAYFDAAKRFPSESEKLASAQINRGESLYWLGQLDRAGEQFADFTKRFPGHPAGWRALVRLAEIEGRKSGEAAATRARAGFLETINRYPFSPGAVIARMRLIPCDDHGGFDAKTAADFFKAETEKFDGRNEVRLDRFAEFRSMIRVRSMILLDDPVAALDAAIKEREEISRKSSAYAWLRGMERKLFRKRVVALLDAGSKFEAVQFYDKYADKVNLAEEMSEDVTPERLALADPEYLLRLSRAASELSLGRTAEQIAKRYDREAKGLGGGRAIASTGLEGRLKASERDFTDAKALWVVDRKKNETAIREKLAGMSDESPFAYQKEIILGLIAESDKKWASALSHASKASMLLSKMSQDDSLDRIAIDQWTAALQEQGGNTRSALETYRKLQRANPADGSHAKAEGVGLKPIAPRENWILSEAELAGKLGKWGEASEAYGRAVKAGLGGNRALYQYALSLEKSGENQDSKIEELLKQAAASDKNDFWKELARKKLAGANAKEGNAL